MEKVSFQTDDKVMIIGNYWQGSEKAVLLLHMLPATKESWNDFASTLEKEGFTVLAIDLRGHGESIKQCNTVLDYRKFSDDEHQKSIMDIEAAVKFLKEHETVDISIAGASIGANLALQYQSNHKEIQKTVLLSPGINYRGIITIPYAEKLSQNQKVFIAAGTLDGRTYGSAADMANEIANSIKSEKEVKIFDTTSHGTDLFVFDKNLMQEIIEWLKM